MTLISRIEATTRRFENERLAYEARCQKLLSHWLNRIEAITTPQEWAIFGAYLEGTLPPHLMTASDLTAIDKISDDPQAGGIWLSLCDTGNTFAQDVRRQTAADYEHYQAYLKQYLASQGIEDYE